MAQDNVVYDINGYDVITNALLVLLNQYPALDNEEISFCSLQKEEGTAMYPISGGIIQKETNDITGHVEQDCMYPFYIIYRASGLSERNKIKAKEWLDNLGKWLEKQVISVRGTEYQLNEYPTLVGDRKFNIISRTSPAYLNTVNEDNVEDWAINLQAIYHNEFDR